jgi:hypothetical protein
MAIKDLVVNFIGKNQLSKTTVVINKDLQRLARQAKLTGGALNKSLGGLGLGIGFAVITNGLKNSVIGFEKAEIASRKLDSVLTSMGFATASTRVDAYAETLQNLIAVDADVIKATQTKLATFSALTATVNVAGGAFDRATVAALDLAAAGFGTAEGNAVQLGKALQDPIKGLTSLSKSGVTFTALEKDKIKTLVETNQVLAAQDLILKAIEVQVGGTAQAGASEFAKLQFIFDTMSDTIGEALLPAVREFSAYLISPEGKQNTKEIVDLFVAIGTTIGNIVSYMLANIGYVKTFAVLLIGVKISMGLIAASAALVNANILKAVTATKLLKIALISTGFGAVAVIAGSIAAGFAEAAESADSLETSVANISDRFNDDGANVDNLGPDGIPLWSLGYATIEEYNAAEAKAATIVKDKKAKAVADAKALADKVRAALKSKIEEMKSTAENFRDAVSLSFGLFGEDENSVFNVDYFKAKLTRMVTAAKGFVANIKRIRDIPGGEHVANELIAMGPVEGNIAAKALLASGDLKEIIGLQGSLYDTGAKAGAVQATMGNASYEININKAVITAKQIIDEIKLYEKKTGRKYLTN